MVEGTTRWKQFNSIIDNENLNLKEKAVLLIIFRYVNHKTCYSSPSRSLIKKLTGISDNRTLDNILNSLIKKGYLTRQSGKGIRSKYYIKVEVKNKLGVEITPGAKITPLVDGEITPTVGGENTPQKEKKKKIKENIYIPVINYLNQKVGTSYKATTKKTQSLINARVNEGFTLNDFKKVIDIKTDEWKVTDFEKFLRPDTLFSPKFESYLNQAVRSKRREGNFENLIQT